MRFSSASMSTRMKKMRPAVFDDSLNMLSTLRKSSANGNSN